MTDNSKLPALFGKRVRELRLQKGLSQEDLAHACNLDRTYISSVERGQRNISLKNIGALASALDVTIAQFFDGLDRDAE